ncbi:hypothetical protein D1007_07116 [Hordeum vulgare]|nr:hypothetical protein D1007_07116 [Hordeum vulgare]
MYLELLTDWDTQYSWGSAALAYLYRQLDQASTRTKETSSLCGYSRRNNHDISNWANKQHRWIVLWNQRDTLVDLENRPHNESAYQKYLVWYGQRYQLKLKPGWTREEWSELVPEDPSAAEGYHAFNMVVRETAGGQVDYAQMHDEMGREFLMCVNDVNVALSHPQGGALSERTLRTTVEKFKARFHKWAAMLSCHGAQFVDMFTTEEEDEEEEEEEDIEEEEAEGEDESSKEEEEEVPTRKGKATKRGRRK